MLQVEDFLYMEENSHLHKCLRFHHHTSEVDNTLQPNYKTLGSRTTAKKKANPKYGFWENRGKCITKNSNQNFHCFWPRKNKDCHQNKHDSTISFILWKCFTYGNPKQQKDILPFPFFPLISWQPSDSNSLNVGEKCFIFATQ